MVELIASSCCEAKIINEFKNGLDIFIVKHNDYVQSLAEKEIAQESHWLLEVKRVPWGKSHSLFALFFILFFCKHLLLVCCRKSNGMYGPLVWPSRAVNTYKEEDKSMILHKQSKQCEMVILIFFNILLVNIIALTSLYIVKNTKFFKLTSLPISCSLQQLSWSTVLLLDCETQDDDVVRKRGEKEIPLQKRFYLKCA